MRLKDINDFDVFSFRFQKIVKVQIMFQIKFLKIIKNWKIILKILYRKSFNINRSFIGNINLAIYSLNSQIQK